MVDKYYLKLNLYYFNDDKTEAPTEKKKQKAREDGQVSKSQELSIAISLIVTFSAIRSFSPKIYEKLLEVFYHNLNLIKEHNDIFERDYLIKYGTYVFTQIIMMCLPFFLVIVAVGVITNIAQVGWFPTFKPLEPKFSKINPFAGIKRMFSMKAIVELIKSIAKLVIISGVIYSNLKKEEYLIFKIIDMEILEAVAVMGDVITNMGINVGMMYLFIGIIDFGYNKFKGFKDLKMSKQEVKDEYKQAEGDPHVKGAIKQRMREVSMRRMMQELPTADVIITNPTHFAVALRYDQDKDQAPIVIAKGADFMAQKIKEVAKEKNIEIVENKPLARALYATGEIGKAIPSELYQVVAEILAYIYKLKNVI